MPAGALGFETDGELGVDVDGALGVDDTEAEGALVPVLPDEPDAPPVVAEHDANIEAAPRTARTAKHFFIQTLLFASLRVI